MGLDAIATNDKCPYLHGDDRLKTTGLICFTRSTRRGSAEVSYRWGGTDGRRRHCFARLYLSASEEICSGTEIQARRDCQRVSRKNCLVVKRRTVRAGRAIVNQGGERGCLMGVGGWPVLGSSGNGVPTQPGDKQGTRFSRLPPLLHRRSLPPQAQTQHKLLSVVSLLFPLRPVYLPLRQS